MQEQWEAVDSYFESLFVPGDDVLESALHDARREGLPAHHVSATQGKLLMILATALGARSILEIGTLGGYSTIWLARALYGDGKLISLEIDPNRAEIARTNLDRAGLSDHVQVRVGPAVQSLAELVAEGGEPFDFVFIDADKPSYAAYLEWSLKLTRPGSLIVADNVVRDGAVIDDQSEDPAVQGVRHFSEILAASPGLTVTAVQTVGSKGYDGFVVALVTGSSSP